jgi:hypothetical protein
MSTMEQTVYVPHRTHVHSASDTHLFEQQHPTSITTSTISSLITEQFSTRQQDEHLAADKTCMFKLTPAVQTEWLTHLSIYYVSSLESIEMIAITLIGQ